MKSNQDSGSWEIYNGMERILKINEKNISYYGYLTGIRMGDIGLVGHALRIKNVFGIAKRLLPGQILEALTRRISPADFK